MRRSEKYIRELKAIFINARDKHEANYKSVQVMSDASGDPQFFTEILQDHLSKSENYNTLHYPVVGINIELNEYFGLVANCWIPLPDRQTNMSTKSIHHHGDMLLTTATAFGKGYEHWTFTNPVVKDAENNIWEMSKIDSSPHPLHHVAFVDAWTAHLPFYPPDLTITYALWSNRFKTTWKDRVKRFPIVQRNSDKLRKVAVKAGLAKQLELKVVENFDFYPGCDGFHAMKERKEFDRTSNEDYLMSLFHIIQETGNESLAVIVGRQLESDDKINNRDLAKNYLDKLKSGKKIEGKLSSGHYGLDYANFTREQITSALEALKK